MALSRPYEGILLCLPVVVVLRDGCSAETIGPPPACCFVGAALPLALIIAAGAWMGYYNNRAFGSPLTPPYAVNRATYAMAPYFIWQSPRPEPVYRHAILRDFYYNHELTLYKKIHTPPASCRRRASKAMRGILFYSGLVLLLPLIMLRRVFLDRRIRFLVICMLVLIAGMLIEIFLVPHYLAPFTAVFYAIGLQAMRHLRVWKPDGRPVGLTLVRLIVTLCVVLAGLQVFAAPLHLRGAVWPAWAPEWYGEGNSGSGAR